MSSTDLPRGAKAEVETALWAIIVTFAVILAVGAMIAVASPVRQDVTRWSLDLILPFLASPSPATLLPAIPGMIGYCSAVLFQPLTVVFVFMAIEIWLSGQPKSWSNTARSLFYRTVQMLCQAAIAYLVAATITRTFFGPVITIQPFDGHPVAFLLSTAAVTLVAMIVHDFATYWAHRFEHRIKPLWRFHSVHHSVTDLDAANSYAHPMDQVVAILCIGLIGSLVNFTYENFLIITAVKTVHEIFIHTRAPIHFGPLRRWLVDNRYHHFHHSIHYKHYNRNFGEYFTIWDRVFGTCYIPADDEMVPTGVHGTKQARNLWEYLTGSLERTGEDMLDPEPDDEQERANEDRLAAA
ncbi:MAG TPA: sterol desaturase family protein [Sphingopyxis sp.]|nr:sterol desaturase family protein [Sphingopyxis sp.]HMQ19703.1 sterol desaturase family protein [Sphingopyxis sp.]